MAATKTKQIKTKQKRRISHNQLGGRSLRYVEEKASSVQVPTPGWLVHPRLVTIQSSLLNNFNNY